MMIWYTIEKLMHKIKAIPIDDRISIGIKYHIHLDLGYADDVKVTVD